MSWHAASCAGATGRILWNGLRVCMHRSTRMSRFVGARSCMCFLCMMHLRLDRLTHTGFHTHARQTAFKHNPHVSVVTCFVCSVVFGNYGSLLLGWFVHSDQQHMEQGWLWLPTHAYRRLPRVHMDLHCMCLMHRMFQVRSPVDG